MDISNIRLAKRSNPVTFVKIGTSTYANTLEIIITGRLCIVPENGSVVIGYRHNFEAPYKCSTYLHT